MTNDYKIELISSAKAKQFFERHYNDDPVKLLLKYAGKTDEAWLSKQLALRKKAQKKLPTWSAHNALIYHDKLSLEQCTSEAVAKLKAKTLKGKNLLDITAGFGVDLYHMGKNFEASTGYEENTLLADVTAYNLTQLNLNATIYKKQFNPTLLTTHYSLIYADPARRDVNKKQVVALEDYTPNMLEMLPSLLLVSDRVLIKTSPMISISQAIEQLKAVVEVWVISHKNECKEVLFMCQKQSVPRVGFRLFNITPTGLESFEYDSEEYQQKCDIFNGEASYIYEPNASIMKAGAVDLIGLAYKLQKAHPNTNLLLSKKVVPNFPGKIFQVLSYHGSKDKSLRKQKLNVVSRNFYEKADKIAERLQLKPAKNDYLIVFKQYNHKGNEQNTFALAKYINP